MIEKAGKDNWIVSCDFCSNQEELEEVAKFLAVIEEIKALGWLPVRVKGEWGHKCPDCLQAAVENQS